MRSSTPNGIDSHSPSAEEALLRATLAERAEFDVESERDWGMVAPHLRFETAPAREASIHARKTPVSWVYSAFPRLWPRSWLSAAMLAATCVALMGIGFATFEWAGPFVGQKLGLIGEQRLYTAINQARDDAGVTIVVDKAYADPGNVYIAFRIQPDHAVAGSFSLATFSLTDQYGEEGGSGNIQCAERTDSIASQVCVFDSSPFHPPSRASSLTLTLDVQALYRVSSNGDSQRIEGSWRFVFAVPFHTKSLGPGGPYAEPTQGASH